MTQEAKRCQMAFEEAEKGKKVAMVCSGDAGVYGMSGLMLEIGADYPEVEVEVIPGVTAALSGGAVLGAPLTHDFAVISLSDRLTPWDKIEKRLKLAAEADFSICLYNPSSKGRPDYLKRACDILLSVLPGGPHLRNGRKYRKRRREPCYLYVKRASRYAGEYVYDGVYRKFDDKRDRRPHGDSARIPDRVKY